VTPLQPHPQRWQALAELVGVSPNADSVKSDHTGRELRFSIFSGQGTTEGRSAENGNRHRANDLEHHPDK